MTLDLTLDGGITWIAEDPILTAEQFDPADYPNLAPLLDVPEPASLSLFCSALGGFIFLRRRKSSAAKNGQEGTNDA
jgi:hypothetical protein